LALNCKHDQDEISRLFYFFNYFSCCGRDYCG